MWLSSKLRTSVAMALAAAALAGQTPDASQQDTVIRSTVREVVLDVVVRHKNQSLDNKLQASDFTVTEDGVPQTIKSFRFVGGREAQPAPDAAPAKTVNSLEQVAKAQANSTREPGFVSIVFDQIGPSSRDNAIRAATIFLDQEFQANTYAAVFRLNTRLYALHNFSNNREDLQKAVSLAVGGNQNELASASGNVLNQTDYETLGGQGGVGIVASTDVTLTPDMAMSNASTNPLSESQQALAAMVGDQRGMVDYINGMKNWNELMQIIRYESALPGRKTVLYLSEGLGDPPGNHGFVRNVISAANRGNIAFYCIDVRGLEMGTSNGMTMGLLNTASALGRTQSVMSSSPGAARHQAQEMDIVDQAMASHIQENMAELAESTGGFAVFNSNDMSKSMARIMEDVRTHYEISYTPTSSVYDGHFRKIEVKTSDPKLILQTREGYFALPELNGQHVLPYELPALAALNGGARHDFDFHAAALRFKPSRDGYRFEMAFEVNTGALTTPIDATTKKARVHATFLALIRDASGQVVDKISRDVDREVPGAELERFRTGDITFTTPFEKPSGRYTIDAVIIDPAGNRASKRRMSLLVPKPGAPTVSNIEVVRRILPLEDTRDSTDPLEFTGGKVTPALNQSTSATSGTALFFVVYGDGREDRPAPKVTVSFYQNGAEVGRSTPSLGKPDEANAYPVIQSAKLPPGNYVAKVTVEQAGMMSTQSTSLNVNP